LFEKQNLEAYESFYEENYWFLKSPLSFFHERTQ
jgi:hypothetical protein